MSSAPSSAGKVSPEWTSHRSLPTSLSATPQSRSWTDRCQTDTRLSVEPAILVGRVGDGSVQRLVTRPSLSGDDREGEEDDEGGSRREEEDGWRAGKARAVW